MKLLGLSVMGGILGYGIGTVVGNSFFANLMGFIGFTTPSLILLEEIYKDITKKNDSDNK